jgi:uncharacterized protein YjeT (DUF2065 family)
LKKPQVFVVIIALVLLGLLYFVAPRSNNELKPASSNSAENQTVTNK